MFLSRKAFVVLRSKGTGDLDELTSEGTRMLPALPASAAPYRRRGFFRPVLPSQLLVEAEVKEPLW